jgi:hypothetical protein
MYQPLYTENDWRRDDAACDACDACDARHDERERECEEDDLREMEREIELMTWTEAMELTTPSWRVA